MQATLPWEVELTSAVDHPPQHRLPPLGLVCDRRHGDRRLKQPGEGRLARLKGPAPAPAHGGSLSVVRLAVHDEQRDIKRGREVYGGKLSGARLDERRSPAPSARPVESERRRLPPLGWFCGSLDA